MCHYCLKKVHIVDELNDNMSMSMMDAESELLLRDSQIQSGELANWLGLTDAEASKRAAKT